LKSISWQSRSGVLRKKARRYRIDFKFTAADLVQGKNDWPLVKVTNCESICLSVFKSCFLRALESAQCCRIRGVYQPSWNLFCVLENVRTKAMFGPRLAFLRRVVVSSTIPILVTRVQAAMWWSNEMKMHQGATVSSGQGTDWEALEANTIRSEQ
jgi:hypothetical protein